MRVPWTNNTSFQLKSLRGSAVAQWLPALLAASPAGNGGDGPLGPFAIVLLIDSRSATAVDAAKDQLDVRAANLSHPTLPASPNEDLCFRF